MPTYCASADVLLELPPSPPSSVTDNIDTDIAHASDLVEAGVGTTFPLAYSSNTQKFPDIDASPATPKIVALAAIYLAAARQYQRMGQLHEKDPNQRIILEDKANEILEKIREGEIDVVLSDGTSIYSSKLKGVEDPHYEDRNTPNQKAIFNPTELENF